MKLRSLIALTIFFSMAFVAVPAQAEECPEAFCELVFEYTGSPEYFAVPAGAENISFEINGAAGGRGGMGGQVTGEFINSPAGFWVLVGGEGVIGADAPGGFNGGGRSGGSRGNEGSGGGASDIRSGTNLNERIVVAGGGGGGGGYAGAAGGAGGNLAAENGGSGQGSGGGGGRENSGGFGGASNGGSASKPGVFGGGGSGGSSWNAGGGGGGGGWFGGGGGGADDDSCCSDAGGGGGGSSHANTSLVTEIKHQAGIQNAAGQVIIHYELTSKITGFAGSQQSRDEVLISMEVEGSFTPNSTDLEIRDTECVVSEPEVNASTYLFRITGCIDSSFQAVLAAEAAELVVDEVTATLEIELDLVGPEFNFVQISSADEDYLIDLVGSEVHSDLSPEDILVSGCSSTALLDQRLSLNDCEEGAIRVTLASNAVSDSMGNPGPSGPAILELTRDTIAPTSHWLEPEFSETGGKFNLVISLRHDDFLIEGAAVEFLTNEISCVPVTTSSKGEITLEYEGCAPGSMRWTLPAFSLIDSAGNSGPASDSVLELTLTAPARAPTPPEPEPDNIPLPVEDPELIDPDVTDEILEFIEDEELLPSDQESQSKTVATIPTQSNGRYSPQIQGEPFQVASAHQLEDLESEVLETNDEEALLDRNPVPTQSTMVAELASGSQKPSGPDLVSQISPWLAGGPVAAVLAFIGYRKMMVR